MSRHRAPELAFAVPKGSGAEVAVGTMLLTWGHQVTFTWFTDHDTAFVVVQHPVSMTDLIRRRVLSIGSSVREVDL